MFSQGFFSDCVILVFYDIRRECLFSRRLLSVPELSSISVCPLDDQTELMIFGPKNLIDPACVPLRRFILSHAITVGLLKFCHELYSFCSKHKKSLELNLNLIVHLGISRAIRSFIGVKQS